MKQEVEMAKHSEAKIRLEAEEAVRQAEQQLQDAAKQVRIASIAGVPSFMPRWPNVAPPN